MGYLLGGLLSGLGKGMHSKALQDRKDALERLRNQRGIAKENRTEIRVMNQEGRAEDRAIASDERQYGIKKGLLKTSGDIKSSQSSQDFKEQKDIESHKGSIGERLARIKSTLDTKRDAASIELRNELDSGNIDDVLVDSEGNYLKVFKDGRTEKTDILAQPSASQQKRLDEDEDDYQLAVKRARRRGDPDPVREEKTRGVAGASAKTKKTEAVNTISQNEITQMYTDASSMAARGEEPFKGLNAAQIKAKVEELVKAKGLQLP